MLRDTVVLRGTIGPTRAVEVTPTARGESTLVITAVRVKAVDQFGQGAVRLEVSGRPLFALQGATPGYRDLKIANTTLVAVLERIDEIGLRRALGAGQRHIAGQFLTESSVLGMIGGLLAAGAGVAVVVGISAARQWTPTVEPWTVLAAPLVGCLTGLLSGAYPAIRASRIQPAEALRQ